MPHLIIYGVFDCWDDDRCAMVGSTVKALSVRAKGYKRYKWFQADRFQHRLLWEGEVEEDEFLPFLRAAKEACWIGRMRTWWDQYGYNQCNPVKAILGNIELLGETAKSAGRASALWRKQNPERAFKIYSDGGKLGGRTNASKPGFFSRMGRSASPENKRQSQLNYAKKHPQEAHARAVNRGRAGGLALSGNLTDEARRKMSEAKKGKPSPRKGAVVSTESRQKMREAALRRHARERLVGD
jgi:NUMOD3 motif